MRAPSSSLPLVTLILITISYLSTPASASCPKCRKSLHRSKRRTGDDASSSEDDLEEYSTVDLEAVRLEYIKQQILQRLGMSKAPKVQRKPDEDIATLLNMFEQQKHQEESTTGSPSFVKQREESMATDKVFVIPVISTKTSTTFNLTLNPASSHTVNKISLYLKLKIRPGDLESMHEKEITLIASAWKDRTGAKSGMPFTPIGSVKPAPLLTSSFLSTDDERQQENRLPVDQPQSRWVEYDLTNLLKSHLTDNRRGGNFITINTNNFKIYSSTITMDFNERQVTRKKRSMDCEPGSKTPTCCRENFYVNFTHIGWDNWILQPTGYSANYCKGECDLSHARYHHTTVVQKYPAQISLCCSPREMSHISFIYVDHDGFVYSKILHNMTVESCDCA